MDYKCPICGKKFFSYNKKRTTCSKICLYKHQSRTVTKKCRNCNKDIIDRASRFTRAKDVFCNKKCQHESEKITKVQFPQLRNKKWCIKQYETKSLLKIAKELGCGETTVYKFFKIHDVKLDRKQWLRGDKHYFWKGGITKFCHQIRTCSEYIRWKKTILEICPRICVLCGSTEQLEVDHIKQLKFILLDNNIKTLDDARCCNELWDIKNGRILCRKCNMIGCNINRQLFSTQTPK